jgi:hypothetical protein
MGSYRPQSKLLAGAFALGGLAFIVACTVHEAVGHGLACVLEGARPLRLTAVYFACRPASVVADLGGPIANLVTVLLALLALRRAAGAARAWWLLVAAFSMCWVGGEALVGAVTLGDDFAYALRSLQAPWQVGGRIGTASAGLALYAAAVRLVKRAGLPRAWVCAACLGAGVESCCAALFYAGALVPALREAALESLVSFAPLLLARPASVLPVPQIGQRWYAAAALGGLAFAVSLGRGLV